MTKPEELIKLLEEYKEGLTPEEIAYEMGFSTVGSVPSAISRARKVCPNGKTIILCKPKSKYFSCSGQKFSTLLDVSSDSYYTLIEKEY